MHKLFLPTVIILLLSSCGSNRDKQYTGFDFPYVPDMHQGNIVNSAVKAKLALGMSKDDVTELLGAPVVTDDFDDDHWMYITLEKINGEELHQQHFELYFKNNQLVKIN